MIATPLTFKQSRHQKLKVWVLSPAIETVDDNIDYYYDFSQSLAEYSKLFEALQLNWVWQAVTMKNFCQVIENIDAEKQGNNFPVVLNLCDGDELNGAPGISVVKMLEAKDIVYTGADEYFYHVTTSKIPMKLAFDKAGISTAPWKTITGEDTNCEAIFAELGTTIIVKPAVSGGSMGVGTKNIVQTQQQLAVLLKQMFEGYRGWDLTSGGVIAERFVAGREFTVFISGSHNDPFNAVIYTPVERVFHASLPDNEKFLSFDRLWEIYEEETPMPRDENFYEYAAPEDSLIDALKQLSWDAYCATRGTGYTRVDIRMDAANGKLYVLEVNAQCGISEDENYTSIGAILRFDHKSFTNLIVEILNDAFTRAAKKGISSRKHSRRKIA